jgi:hypothetical protein
MITMPPRVPHNFDAIRCPVVKHVASSVQCRFLIMCSIYTELWRWSLGVACVIYCILRHFKWLVGWIVGLLGGWLFGWLVGLTGGWLCDWLVGRLVCLVGQLVGLLV